MKKLKRMTSEELIKFRKKVLGITQKRLAEYIKKVTGKCSLRSIQNWEQKERQIPLHIRQVLFEIKLIMKIKVGKYLKDGHKKIFSR